MSWITYLLQVNIYLILFYLFYSLLLRNDTFFQYNRIYLLSTTVISFLIPVARLEWIKDLFISGEIYSAAEDLNNILILGNPGPAESADYAWPEILKFVYLSGVFLSAIMLLIKLIRLNAILKGTPPKAAFSFFNRIKIDPNLPNNKTILEHEHVHVKQLHSVDTIFFELVTIINWFNPILYYYKRTIKHLHEYIADETAAKIETTKADYALILLSNVMDIPSKQLTNNFFSHSLLKRRIFMLHKERSRKAGLLKYALSIPLFIAMTAFSSASFSEIQDRGSRRTTFPTDTSLYHFAKIDVLPEFPGGQDKFYQYVGAEFKYPAEARKKGLKGRVTLSFIVEKDGTLTNIEVIREPGLGTGEEAVRVLQNSPRWKPGMNGGKPVRVEYTLPIQLELAADDDSESEKKTSIELNGRDSSLFLLDLTKIAKTGEDNLNENKRGASYLIKNTTAIIKYGTRSNEVALITTKD